MIEWHDLFSDIYHRRKIDSEHEEGSHHGNAILYIEMMNEVSCTRRYSHGIRFHHSD